MVADGLWNRAPRPRVLLAQHIKAIASDQLLIGSGHIMNLGDSWRVTVTGRGAHASRPHESIDPILLAAHIVVRLQTVVSREVSPQDPAVLTVATFHAGTKENVIPDTATITLNIRTPDPEVRDRVLAAVTRIVNAEAAASGAPEPVIETISSFPRCYSDPRETSLVADAFDAVFGAPNVDRTFRTTGSEDVGTLADSIGIPMVFWFFGAYDPDRSGELPQNHTAQFAPDAESSFTAGLTAALTALEVQLGRDE
jgi:hippurate hydrolase